MVTAEAYLEDRKVALLERQRLGATGRDRHRVVLQNVSDTEQRIPLSKRASFLSQNLLDARPTLTIISKNALVDC